MKQRAEMEARQAEWRRRLELRRAQAAVRAKARREREKAARQIADKRDAKLREKEEKCMGRTRAQTKANIEAAASKKKPSTAAKAKQP